LFGKWLDMFIQNRWSDGDLEKEILPTTRQRWMDLAFCTKPRNMLMKRLQARWISHKPEGMAALDSMANIYPAHKMGNSHQLLVCNPVRWAKFLGNQQGQEAETGKR
jgi:hypothetical protein